MATTSLAVAILELHGVENGYKHSAATSRIAPPAEFKILLLKSGPKSRQLPSCSRRRRTDGDDSEEAIRLSRRILADASAKSTEPTSAWLPCCRRAIRVSFWKDTKDFGFRRFEPLYCVPLISQDVPPLALSSEVEFTSLDWSFAEARTSEKCSLDVESRHMLSRLEEWLQERQKSKDFISHLFYRPSSASRLSRCVHNPGHEPGESRACNRDSIRCRAAASTSTSLSSSFTYDSGAQWPNCSDNDNDYIDDLEDAKRRGNDALVNMTAWDKFDVIVINPLFGSKFRRVEPTGCKSDSGPICYIAKGLNGAVVPRRRPSLDSSSSNSASPADAASDSSAKLNWADQFPLHHFAYLGQADRILSIIAQRGCDSNAKDNDTWTPLHYASWYGRLEALKCLLNHAPNVDVNAVNRNGSTALHFAAWNAHAYAVELLLSHPDIKLEKRDNDGKTALELCDCNPRDEWRAVAQLLRAAKKERLPKMQIDLMDMTNVMVYMVNGVNTTTAELQEQVCAELKLSQGAAEIFALWICSPSLEFQLKTDHRPKKHLDIWQTKILPEWSDCTNPMVETPTLVFRRDVRIPLEKERAADLDGQALSLLFEEARSTYLLGLYPNHDSDIAVLSAFLLHIATRDHKIDKQLLNNERILLKIIPSHLLAKGSKYLDNLKAKILKQHKLLSEKAKPKPNLVQLQYNFLSYCRTFRMYGAAYFNGTVFMQKPLAADLHVYIGVNECGLHIINSQTRQLFNSYPLKHLDISEHDSRKPYLNVRTTRNPQHVFVLKTAQARQVTVLINKLMEQQQKTQVRSAGSSKSSRLSFGGRK